MARKARPPRKPQRGTVTSSPAVAAIPFNRAAADRRGVALAAEEYARTRNPLHIWHAYLACRSSALEVPEWVLEYFDRVGRQLWGLLGSHPRGKPVAPVIVGALEMNGRGRGNVFSDYMRRHYAFMLACEVHWYIRKDGMKPYLAIEAVARDRGASVATVLRAWHTHKDALLSDS